MSSFSGRIVADATTKHFEKSNSTVVNYKIVENRKYKGKDGQLVEDSLFIECSDWVRISLAPHLVKGAIVAVEGDISLRAFLDDEKLPVAALKLRVDKFRFLSSPNKSDAPATPKSESVLPTSEEFVDDLPF